MTPDEFQKTLSDELPTSSLRPVLNALWWAAKDDWEKAHTLVMSDESPEAAWIHAYLHRVEGDLPNARYWYRTAGRPAASGSLDEEWTAIVSALLGAETRN